MAVLHRHVAGHHHYAEYDQCRTDQRIKDPGTRAPENGQKELCFPAIEEIIPVQDARNERKKPDGYENDGKDEIFVFLHNSDGLMAAKISKLA
jgi:hypothetical protein